jgi:hypothetical protein
MAQVRGTFSELYDNVDKTFYGIMKDQLKELARIYPEYFNIKTSDRKFERVVTYVPFGDTASKPEGETYAMDTIRPGYTKALEDDPESILNGAGQWLAFSGRYVEEGRAANVLNNGFTTELTPDGVSLFNSAHALKGGGTARNRPSTDADLSASSLQQALIDLQTDQKDEAGHLAAPITNLKLVVPPALEFLAHRLLNSQQLPGTADNDVNPIKARRTWDLIVNPRLSDTDAWFIVAGSKAQHGLTFYRRVPISTEPMAIDARTGNRIFKVRHRFSVGAWTWIGTYGTAGA